VTKSTYDGLEHGHHREPAEGWHFERLPGDRVVVERFEVLVTAEGVCAPTTANRRPGIATYSTAHASDVPVHQSGGPVELRSRTTTSSTAICKVMASDDERTAAAIAERDLATHIVPISANCRQSNPSATASTFNKSYGPPASRDCA
jgi:hypothetical protein